MLKNYLIITLRNLSRNIFYVLINVIGLGLALAVCIVAYLNNKFDADFDKFHINRKNIYKVESYRPIQERPQWYGITPISMGPLVKNEISGVKEVVRVQMTNSPVKVGEKNFSKRIAWCDPAFFDVFTIQMISGSSSAFQDKNTILLDEELADIYFCDEEHYLSFSAVESNVLFSNSPENSSFKNKIYPSSVMLIPHHTGISWRTLDDQNDNKCTVNLNDWDDHGLRPVIEI